MRAVNLHAMQMPATKPARKADSAPQKENFSALFADEAERIKFSNHATQRLAARNIALSSTDLQKLESAIDRMAENGARKSVIFMDVAAFVVSVPNRTIVTAVDDASAKENIFTDIDSAAIL